MTTRGFTLLEVLLSVAIIGVLAGVGAVVYEKSLSSQNVSLSQKAIVDSLYRAESLARDGASASSWGVAIASNHVVVYKGASYATRDTTADDDIYTIPVTIAVSGDSEVPFPALFDTLSRAYSITLTFNATPTTISISKEGLVSY
jgi:prepilin-type N-terminal cleavage/methylation domain-containing protein